MFLCGVCICVYMWCIYEYMCVHMCGICVCLGVCISVCVWVVWHVCVQVCEWGVCMSVRMSVCMCDMCVVCIRAVCLCVNLCLLTGRAGVKSSGAPLQWFA